MKLNNLFIIFFIISAAFLASCNDFEDTVVSSPKVAADCPAVRFASDNGTSFEIEPSSDMSFTVTVLRDNFNAAVEIPLTVTDSTNSFNVPSKVSFAAGDSSTTLKIGINSTAEKGVAIPIVIKFDSEDVNPYKTEYGTYYGSISIIQWNNLGKVQFYDSFSFYDVAEVTLEQRNDIPSVYRINFPYKEDILLAAEWEGWIGGRTQDKIIFTISGNNVVWDSFWYTNLLNDGTIGQEIKAYLPSAISKTGDNKSVVVKNDEGSIQYFKMYPYFYVDGVGGWGLKAVYLGFPGFDLAGNLELPIFGQ